MSLGIGRGRITKPVEVTEQTNLHETGVNVQLFDDFFSFEKPKPKIEVVQPLEVPVDSKRPKVSSYKPGKQFVVDKDEQQNFQKEAEKELRSTATRCLYKSNTQRLTSQTSDSNQYSSQCLDDVSTHLNDTQETLDPEIRQSIEPFFNTIRPLRIDSFDRLPILDLRKVIVNQIKLNRICIIEGETGCGKTTQVPQFIMDDSFKRNQNFNIVVTQPRRIAAISIAKRVCQERNWNIGDIVGYQIGITKEASETTRLLFCTTGVLLQKIIATKKINNYTHIIIDEVHERNSETDLLLNVIRTFLWREASSVKVILMSATFDTKKFQSYFTHETPTGDSVPPAVVEVTGRPKNIIKSYINQFYSVYKESSLQLNSMFDLKEPCIPMSSMMIALHLIQQFDNIEADAPEKYTSGKGAVLVFLPGFDSITDMMKLLNSNAKYSGHWKILPLHSSITLEEQRRVFEPTRRGERKIILATNIAESSITVPDVEYVIDFCLTKNLVCDQETGYPVLKLEWATKTNCEQRAGRAGRVKDGRVYRMVPSHFYDKLDHFPVPELVRCPLEMSILKVKELDCGSPKLFLALCLDPPDLSDIKKSILKLKRVGAITIKINDVFEEEDGDLTVIGSIMAALPLDVQLSRLIIFGYVLDLLDDCIIMAACLSIHNIFSKPFDKPLEAYKSKLAWSDRTFSDGMACWNAYKMYTKLNENRLFNKPEAAKNWCKSNFIQYKRLRDVDALVDELRKRLKDVGLITPTRPNLIRSSVENELILKIAMCGAFAPNFFLQETVPPSNVDTVAQSIRREINGKDPCTTVRLDGFPLNEGVLYANQLKFILKECSPRMLLEFEDSKAYVTFSGEDNPLEKAKSLQSYPLGAKELENLEEKEVYRNSDVRTSVYVAIKLRSKKNLELNKLPHDKVRQELQKIENLRNIKERCGPICTNRIRINDEKKGINAIELPNMMMKKVDIFITYIIDCGHFWAQYRDERTQEYLNEIDNLIDVNNLVSYNDPKENDYIVIHLQNEEKKYIRARVVEVNRESNIFKIFSIDYGYYSLFKFSEMHKCFLIDSETSLYQIPALAFECVLAGIRVPEYRLYDSNYSNEALNYFTKEVMNRTNLWAMVYSVVDNIVRLILFSENTCINENLIREGFAEKCEEGHASKKNNEMRNNEMVVNEIKCLEVSGIDDFGIRTNSHEKLKIRGPFSPIEVNFIGISRANHFKSVSIEQDSVNSICLDSRKELTSQRLLVAANISVSASGKIVARGTTLMPKIPGFAALMIMLFANQVELRIDSNGLKYIGAICGLGHYDDFRSYDCDNDIEISFDVLISQSDIALINLIRLHINEFFSSKENLQDHTGISLSLKQNKIRNTLLKLLRKKRDTQKLDVSRRDYQWGKLPKNSIKSVNVDLEGNTVLPMLSICSIIEEHGWKRQVKSNLETIRYVLENNQAVMINCLLCEENFYTNYNLRNHLKELAHKSRVREMFPEEYTEFELDEGDEEMEN